MTANEKQIKAVVKLSASKRDSHFIKKVVGWKRLWALYDDGRAMPVLPNGYQFFRFGQKKNMQIYAFLEIGLIINLSPLS